MIDLTFDYIEIADFKEFRGEHRVDLRKLGLGVHFVSGDNRVEPRLGSNGAGKSSLWDALCWCFYGRTVSGLRGTDIRTWGGKAHATVRVMLRIDDDKHLIVRSTKTNGLWIDGKVVEQAKIDELIGLSYASFPHTVLLGQGAPLFFDLKPTEKMALLSETLNLDRWEDRATAARKKVQELDGQLAEANGQLAELERTAKDAERSVTDLEERSAEWDRAEAGKAKSNAKQLKEARQALEAAVDKMGRHDLALDGAETEAKATRKKLADKDREIVEFGSTVGGASANVSSLMQQLADFDQEANESADTCAACGQSLKGTALAKHRKEIRRKMVALEADLKTARELLTDLNAGHDRAKRERAKLAGELRGFEDKADDARDGYTRAKAEQSEIAAQVKELEKAARSAEKEQNPYTDLLKQARTQERRTIKLRDDLSAIITLAEQKQARVRYWVTGFKQVRLYLLQEVLDELTGITQTLLPQIGLEDWTVEFIAERETQSGKTLHHLNVNIFKPGHDRAVRWESWSGGEGQRLRLIGAIALSEVLLRRAGVQTDLLILDEPTRHLSQEGVGEMVDFLVDRGADYQILYVDHQAIETNRFGRGIHVIKDDDGSHIE